MSYSIVSPIRNIRQQGSGQVQGLGSPSLELIDPTPDVHRLFMLFNDQFFKGTLCSVTVRWSKRMYSCAGICRYERRAGFCDIALSEPLLKLRSRKDLIETLLHEMIHAYLFITSNNRDRDGHGPEFLSHMYRINKSANLNISVYHSFIDEVKLYKTHWWRCTGACVQRKPFFGLVKRSSNRAPGPNDFWWRQHELTCAGTFVKIKEPEKKVKSKKETKPSKASTTKNDTNSTKIPKYFKKPDENDHPNIIPKAKNLNTSFPDDFKLNNSNINTSTPLRNFNLGTKDIREVVRNHWSEKYNTKRKLDESSPDISLPTGNSSKRIKTSNEEPPIHVQLDISVEELEDCNKILKDLYGDGYNLNSSNCKIKDKEQDTVSCPICDKDFEKSRIEAHVNVCLDSQNNVKIDLTQSEFQVYPDVRPSTSSAVPKSDQNIESKTDGVCPLCKLDVSGCNMEQHLEKCLTGDFLQESFINFDTSAASKNSDVVSLLSDDDFSDDENENIGSKTPCPCCLDLFELDKMNAHLDECLL